MPYGQIKVDEITFTNAGVDQTISVSGVVASISGNITATGTISGDVIRGGTLVSGATVTGTAGQFGTITGNAAGFTTVTGTTVTGTTAQFTTVTGGTAGFTTITGTTVTGTTANFVTVSGTTVTGNVGNFTTVTGGTVTLTSGVFAAGSATNPSISFTSDPNSGLFSPGADQVAISTNGSQRLLVDSIGNIGIGGSVGFGRITHGIHVTGSGTGEGIRLQTSNGSTGILEIAAESGGAVLDTRGSGYIRFNSSTTEWARFDSNGRLGLGTSSPGALLDLAGGSIRLNGTSGIYKANADGYNYFSGGTGLTAGGVIFAFGESHATNANEIHFRNSSNTTRAVIDSSGRVGIGTTSPSRLLHLSSADSTSFSSADFDQTYNFLRIVNTTNDRAAGIYFGIGTNGEAAITAAETTDGETALVFGTRGGGARSERARLDHAGRLLVGTSSASDASKFVVQGQVGANAGQMSVRRNAVGADATILGSIDFDDSSASLGARIQAVGDAAWGTNDYPTRLVFSTTADGASSPTERMRISQNGFIDMPGVYNFTTANAANVNVDATGGMRRSTSSKKYKTDIETLQDSYADALLNCRPVWYRSTCEADCPEHSYWGFIAEEVAVIDPRLVHWKTIDITYGESGSVIETPCEPEPEGVAYDRFVPHLLNLVKRQQEQIEAMEARLSALEAS
jgi:hypothetical protein